MLLHGCWQLVEWFVGASDHFVVFAIKKGGTFKAPPEVREVRSFKRYNKEQFIKGIAAIP